MAVGGLDLAVAGAGDQFRKGTHILGREKLIGRHTDEGAVRLDLGQSGGDTSPATSHVVAVNLVTDIEVGICIPILDELGGLVTVI